MTGWLTVGGVMAVKHPRGWTMSRRAFQGLYCSSLWSDNGNVSKNYLQCTCAMFWSCTWNTKREQSSSYICTGRSFTSTLIREKENTSTKTGPNCNNSSVAWLKTHLCCATEHCVLIGWLSDAELNSLCQSEPVEPNASCFLKAVAATFGHSFTAVDIRFTLN